MEENSRSNYKRHRGGVYNLNYHIIWCPKRRVPILIENIAIDLDSLIRDTLIEMDLKVEALEVMPDHVHLFVSAPPKISPHQIVKRCKGASSNLLRKKYPQLLKMPCLWSSSYYCGSVGQVSESVVRHYIESQKGK